MRKYSTVISWIVRTLGYCLLISWSFLGDYGIFNIQTNQYTLVYSSGFLFKLFLGAATCIAFSHIIDLLFSRNKK